MKVSQHAIDKYLQLINYKINDRELAECRILDLFKHSCREDIHAGLVRRIIDNNFEDAEYYRNEGWRIVISDCTIVTVEKDKFGKPICFDPKQSRKVKRQIRLITKIKKRK